MHGLSGFVDLTTNNSDIDGTRIDAGSAHVTSGNGDVDLAFSTVPDDVVAVSDNCNVTIPRYPSGPPMSEHTTHLQPQFRNGKWTFLLDGRFVEWFYDELTEGKRLHVDHLRMEAVPDGDGLERGQHTRWWRLTTTIAERRPIEPGLDAVPGSDERQLGPSRSKSIHAARALLLGRLRLGWRDESGPEAEVGRCRPRSAGVRRRSSAMPT